MHWLTVNILDMLLWRTQIIGDGVSSLPRTMPINIGEEWYEAGQYPYAATSPQGIVPLRHEQVWVSCQQRRVRDAKSVGRAHDPANQRKPPPSRDLQVTRLRRGKLREKPIHYKRDLPTWRNSPIQKK